MRRFLTDRGALVCVLVFLAAAGRGGTARGDSTGGGLEPSPTPKDDIWARVPGEHLWESDIGRSIAFPPVPLDGDVIIATTDQKVHRVSLTDGDKLWSRKFGGEVTAAPVAAGSPTGGAMVLVAGRGDGTGIIAFSASDGKEIWREWTESAVLLMQVRDGRFWCAEQGGRITSRDTADGAEVWSVAFGGWGSPGFLLLGDRIYALARSDSLVCLDAETGGRVWGVSPGGFYAAPPIAVQDDLAIVTTEGRLLQVEAGSGEVLSTQVRAEPQLTAPVQFGRLVVSVSTGGVIEGGGFGADTSSWRLDLQEAVVGEPVVAGSVILVGSVRGSLHAIEPVQGTLAWTLTPHSGFRAAPTIASDVLVLGTDRGELHAYARAR